MLNKVLIIEDETELSNILKKYLIRRRYEVECVETLRESFVLLSTQSFGAIILDNNLPDGKGLDYIKEFKRLQPELKIIAISALQINDAALNAGANYFIEKPISLKMIESLLVGE